MHRLTWSVTVMAVMLLAACSANRIDLPGVAAQSDGSQLPGKVIWHDLLSDRPEQTMDFYRELFGWEFEPLPAGAGNYTLIRHRGRLIGGLVDQRQLPTEDDVSQWVVVISVVDIERAASAFEAAGGRVLTPPTSLGARGTIAVVSDNQGAALALLQTRDGDPGDGAVDPAPGDFLWDELWARDPAAAGAFYRESLGYAVEEKQLGGAAGQLDYRVFSAGGRPRAGLRERPMAALAPTWVSYLRVADPAQLQTVLGRVEELGGKVLLPATARPYGGQLAVISDPSGAGIALQTWDEGQRLQAAREELK